MPRRPDDGHHDYAVRRATRRAEKRKTLPRSPLVAAAASAAVAALVLVVVLSAPPSAASSSSSDAASSSSSSVPGLGRAVEPARDDFERRTGAGPPSPHPPPRPRPYDAYRPHDAGSGPTVDYGGLHPFEVLERGRRRRLRAEEEESGGARRRISSVPKALRVEFIPPHRPVRIRFRSEWLERARAGSSNENRRKIDRILGTVLPEMGRMWSETLSVSPARGPITVPSGACYGYADVDEDFDVEGADVVILVSALPVDGDLCSAGGTTLAGGAPCESDQWDRPIVGVVTFCLEAWDDSGGDGDVASDLIAAGSHELGHALGMVDYMIPYFRDKDTGDPLTPHPLRAKLVECVDGQSVRVIRPSESVLAAGRADNGALHFEIVTERVVTVVRNHFDCPTMRGARLENQPTEFSCFGSHWDERLFFGDIMGAIQGEFILVLSPVTLAFFEDSGWYRANYTRSGTLTFGRGAGCGFVDGDCIVDGSVPDYSEGFFCDTPLSVDPDGVLRSTTLTCDPSRTHRAACDLADRAEVRGIVDPTVPAPFRYFPGNENMGAFIMSLADYCPIPIIDRGDCRDPTSRGSSKGFEYFGEDSRCYDVEDGGAAAPADRFPACLRTRCDADADRVHVTVDGVEFTCETDGQVHRLDHMAGAGGLRLTCPRRAVVCPDLACPHACSGRGECDWGAPGRPRCVCHDDLDTSPGCDGRAVSGPGGRSAPTELGGCELDGGADMGCVEVGDGGSVSLCVDKNSAGTACSVWIRHNDGGDGGDDYCCRTCTVCDQNCVSPLSLPFPVSFDCGDHSGAFRGGLVGDCGDCSPKVNDKKRRVCRKSCQKVCRECVESDPQRVYKRCRKKLNKCNKKKRQCGCGGLNCREICGARCRGVCALTSDGGITNRRKKEKCCKGNRQEKCFCGAAGNAQNIFYQG